VRHVDQGVWLDEARTSWVNSSPRDVVTLRSKMTPPR